MRRPPLTGYSRLWERFMWGSLVVPVVVLVLVVYAVFLFNQLVSIKHNVGKA